MQEMVKVSPDLIKGCESFSAALRLCFQVSGRSMGEVAWDCGWTDGGRVLSRILRDVSEEEDQRYIPHKRLKLFMLACRNAVPLWWLMMQLELRPEDAPHYEPGADFLQQLAAEQLECKRLLTEVLADVKSAEAVDVEARFCLVEREVIADWLVDEALHISRRFGAWLVTTAL